MKIAIDLMVDGKLAVRTPVTEGVTTLGASAQADICVPHDGVAPVHLVLHRRGSKLSCSNRSEEPFSVNGDAIQESVRLADGDKLTFQNLALRFRFIADDAGQATATMMMHGRPASQVGFILKVPMASGDASWELPASGAVIGTHVESDIRLVDSFVSRRHVKLIPTELGVRVEDLDSRNGVFVGAQRIRNAEIQPPFQLRVGDTVVHVLERETKDSLPSVPALIGESDSMRQLKSLITRVAAADIPTLILGETGTGKEIIARQVAAASARSHRPFLTLNCGALSQELLESELFGHEKGAFTGAELRRVGAFEAADGGTLFLDEIGELPLSMQAALLRSIEYGEVRRVGSSESFRVDVRIIAATNRDLEEEVAAGRFREDLLHRLNVIVLRATPLRERGGDVQMLTEHFAKEFSPPGRVVGFDEAALSKLATHRWPGNVRELRNTIQRALILGTSTTLTADDILLPAVSEPNLSDAPKVKVAAEALTMEEREREAIVDALRETRGNKSEAAEKLGISRSTIHRKLERHAITAREWQE